jgi:hypothetical protein
MVDYDELDAMLLQEEEKQAEEELKKQGERLEAEKIRMEALSEEEREFLDEHYEFDRSRAEMVRNKLELALESARKDYDQIPRDIKNARQDMLGYIVAWLFHTGGYPIVYRFGRGNTLSVVAFSLLGIFWLYYTAKFFVKVLDAIANYCVLTNKKRVSGYVEANKVLTFQKKQDLALERIRYLKDQLTKLENFERKMEHQHGLTESDAEEMSALSHIREFTTPYREMTVKFRECVNYIVKGTAD